MTEYIKRETVMKTAKDGNHSDFEISMADLTSLRDVLEDTPTADVAEVKHGRWIYHERVLSHDGIISGYSCSVCEAFVHEETFDKDTFYKKYCGNCGARMDGKDGE